MTPWTAAHQAPLSLGFSRQEYGSGLPFPSPGESLQSRDQTPVCFISCIDWQEDSWPQAPPGKPRAFRERSGVTSYECPSPCDLLQPELSPQRLHLQTQSHWRLWLLHGDFGEHSSARNSIEAEVKICLSSCRARDRPLSSSRAPLLQECAQLLFLQPHPQKTDKSKNNQRSI